MQEMIWSLAFCRLSLLSISGTPKSRSETCLLTLFPVHCLSMPVHTYLGTCLLHPLSAISNCETGACSDSLLARPPATTDGLLVCCSKICARYDLPPRHEIDAALTSRWCRTCYHGQNMFKRLRLTVMLHTWSNRMRSTQLPRVKRSKRMVR
ncbi:hypothetical protein GGR51DRAFT_539434 [Nemania sp. FL0031]|nr:hypothetical protein GGR51DRAFT_539434 [Nemania sp. FL0031]